MSLGWIGVIVSSSTAKPNPEQPVALGDIGFQTRSGFNIAALVVTLLLISIYVVYW